MAYATRDDVFQLGLTAQAFVARPRPVTAADVDLTTGVIRLEAHGLAASDIITTRVTTGGALPTGAVSLSAFVAYSPSVVSFDLLRILNPATGLPITSFTTTGSGWAIAVDPLRRIDRHLADKAAIIDDQMTAHLPPFEVDPVTGVYHPVLVGLNARLAAMAAVTSLQFENAAARVAVEQLKAEIERDWANLATYLAGRPIRPLPVDQTDVPDNGARAACGTPIEWQNGYL